MYSGRVWPPFSAAYRVALSGPSPLTSYPPAAHLLYLDCIVCITFGHEHHLVTAETLGQQQRLTLGPCGCSSLVQNCQPLRPASLNWPPTHPTHISGLTSPLTCSPVLPLTSDRPCLSSVGFIFSGPFQQTARNQVYLWTCSLMKKYINSIYLIKLRTTLKKNLFRQ